MQSTSILRGMLAAAVLCLISPPIRAGHFHLGGRLTVHGGPTGFLNYSRLGGYSSLHFSLGRGFHPLFSRPPIFHRSTQIIQVYTPPPPVIIQQVPVVEPLPYVDWNREIIDQIFPEARPEARPEAMPRIPRGQPERDRQDDPAKPKEKPPEKKKVDPVPDRIPNPGIVDIPGASEKEKILYTGMQAFRDQKYGLAAERFRRALELDKKDASVHFYLAQAYTSLGRYKLSYDHLLQGLQVDPTWPNKDFRPLDLYGPNVVDYSNALLLLEQALANHPDDPILLFVTACHLWFDGRRVEARPVFERLLPTFPDKGIIESFLQALPGPPVM